MKKIRKMYTIVGFTLTFAVLFSGLTLILTTCGEVPSQPHKANAMWIEPSSILLPEVGCKFNVTVWINLTVACTGWQFKMFYNKNQLNVTAYGYLEGTTPGKSQFFENITTMPVAAKRGSYNATHDYFMHSEAWIMGPKRNPGYGGLEWVEFNVTAPPPEGEIFASIIDISSEHHPPDSKTYALDENGEEVPMTAYNAVCYALLWFESLQRIPEIPNYDEAVIVLADIQPANSCYNALLSSTVGSIWHNVSMSKTGDTYYGEIPPQLYETLVQYKIYANDTNGNWAESTTCSYMVMDTIEPEIVSLEYAPTCPYPFVDASTPRETEPVCVTANINEPVNASGVDEVLFSYRVDGGEWWNTTMKFNATSGLWAITIPGQPANSTVEFFLTAYDNAGNKCSSSIYSYIVRWLPTGDINGDGLTDIKDIVIVALHYGETSP